MPSDRFNLVAVPVTGVFDARSAKDQVGVGSFVLVKNFATRAIGKRCRRGGWTKLFDGVNATYNNEDGHDQLLSLQTYTDSYSALLVGGGAFDHLAYLYYAPSFYQSGYSFLTGANQNYCGNAYTQSAYPVGFTPHSCFVYESYAAYPPYILPAFNTCTLGYMGQNYQGPYFHVECHVGADGYTVQGYPYGPYTAIYQPEFGYEYFYCGTEPHLRGGCREAITFLAEFRSPRNFRKLVAGTKSRLYSLNERTGNWRLLGDGFGGNVDPATDCAACSQRRFMSAQLDNVMLFTNDFDPPMYWYFDDTPGGCNLWSVRVIEDLQDLNVAKAGCVAVFKGFVFFGNLEQDGTYYPSRVIWSDYKQPISYLPTTDSLAGFQDIASGERIMRMESLGDFLYIYTDQAIHRATLVSSGEIFNFEQIYRGPDALKFKFSLVNTGDQHFYWSEQKIMEVTLADANPIEVQWMKATSSVIFDGITETDATYSPINRDLCDLVTGSYNGNFKEVIWSWASGSNLCPDVSLVFNLTERQLAADLVDHGFTAFCLYESDRLMTVAEWLTQEKICTFEQLYPLLIKEGAPVPSSSSFSGGPTSIWNETEDVSLPRSPTSLCAMLANSYPEDFCKGCVGPKSFVMASATDYCLKEYKDSVYYRERLAGDTYVLDPYDSVLASGADNLKTDNEKSLSLIKVQYKAEVQTTANTLYCWAGYGAEANCMSFVPVRIVAPDGTIADGIPLKCLTAFTEAQHLANRTRPGLDASFPCSVRGRFLSYRLKITSTGGGSCFSNVQLNVAQSEF